MIYFIGTINKIDDKYGPSGIRTVGFFETFEEAEQRILSNCCDIYEAGYYPYAVIEAANPGIYPIVDDTITQYYKWNNGKYIKINKTDLPDVINHFINLTIG